MRFPKVALFAMVLFFAPAPAFACEPVIPLALLFGFPIFSLFGVVFLKAAIFAYLERSIPWYRSVIYILGANLVSSLIGVLLCFAVTVPILVIFFAPFVAVIAYRPASRFIRFNPWGTMKNLRPSLLAAFIGILYFGTFLLYFLAVSSLQSYQYLTYWLLKYAYVTLGVTVSLGLTTFWEEYTVVVLARKKETYMIPMLKANLIAIFLIMIVIAGFVLPERMKSKNFLIQNEGTSYVVQVEEKRECVWGILKEIRQV